MDILPQIIVISLISASIYMLIAAGLTLTFGALEFINFAHGDTAMLGGYAFFTLYITLGLPLLLSLALSALLIGILGILIERFTFRPVRDKQDFIPLILSIGISIIIQSLVLMLYGGGSKSYSNGELPTIYSYLDGKVTITLTQIMIIVTSITLVTILHFWLKKSKTGKAIRAVSDNKEIAAIMGIDVNKTIVIIFSISSALAAVAGTLIAFDQNLNPRMGLMLSIKAFAAIVLGGVGKFHGAILGAIIIAFSENLIVGLTDISTSYKETIVFTIFIAILLIKPYGLFGGSKQEVESR